MPDFGWERASSIVGCALVIGPDISVVCHGLLACILLFFLAGQDGSPLHCLRLFGLFARLLRHSRISLLSLRPVVVCLRVLARSCQLFTALFRQEGAFLRLRSFLSVQVHARGLFGVSLLSGCRLDRARPGTHVRFLLF